MNYIVIAIILGIYIIIRIAIFIATKRIKRTKNTLLFLLERRKSTLPMLITMCQNDAITQDLLPFADYINTPTIALDDKSIASQAHLSSIIQTTLPHLPIDYMPANRLNKELVALEERIITAFRDYKNINTYYKNMSNNIFFRMLLGFEKV